MRAVPWQDVRLNAEGTGYVICLPVPGIVTQVQTNMAATLNVDWVLSLAADALRDFGHEVSHRDLVARVDQWLAASRPGLTGYLPYISEAGERGPFVDADARAGTRHVGNPQEISGPSENDSESLPRTASLRRKLPDPPMLIDG